MGERDRQQSRERQVMPGTLRRSGGAGRHHDDSAGPLGYERFGLGVVDQRLKRFRAAVGPGDQAFAGEVRVVGGLGELLVMDEQFDPLVLGDLAELCRGEVGVEQDDVIAEAGRRENRLHETSMVAAQDPDSSVPEPALERGGQRRGAMLQCRIGQHPVLVDQRRTVGKPQRRHRTERRRDGAEADIGQQQPRGPVRAYRLQDPHIPDGVARPRPHLDGMT
jgi:hypothetical protein